MNLSYFCVHWVTHTKQDQQEGPRGAPAAEHPLHEAALSWRGETEARHGPTRAARHCCQRDQQQPAVPSPNCPKNHSGLLSLTIFTQPQLLRDHQHPVSRIAPMQDPSQRGLAGGRNGDGTTGPSLSPLPPRYLKRALGAELLSLAPRPTARSGKPQPHPGTQQSTVRSGCNYNMGVKGMTQLALSSPASGSVGISPAPKQSQAAEPCPTWLGDRDTARAMVSPASPTSGLTCGRVGRTQLLVSWGQRKYVLSLPWLRGDQAG